MNQHPNGILHSSPWTKWYAWYSAHPSLPKARVLSLMPNRTPFFVMYIHVNDVKNACYVLSVGYVTTVLLYLQINSLFLITDTL